MKKEKTQSRIAIALLAVSLALVASGCSSTSSNQPASGNAVTSPENGGTQSPSGDESSVEDPEQSPSGSTSAGDTASGDSSGGVEANPSNAQDKPADSTATTPPRSGGKPAQPPASQEPRSGGKPVQPSASQEPRSGGKPAQPSASEEPAADNPYEAAGIDDPKKFEQFFATVQKLVAADDKEKLADYVLYPMHFISADGKDTPIKDSKAFIKSYDDIFTKEIKDLLQKQTTKDMFVNYKGISMASGQIWFSVVEKGKIGLLTVNQSAPAK